MSLFPSSARSARSFRETNFPQFTFNCAETYPAFSQCSFYYRCYVGVLHRAPFTQKVLCVFLFSISIFIFSILTVWYLFNLIVIIDWVGLVYRLFFIFLLFILILHQTQYFSLFNSNMSTNNRFLVVFRFPVPTEKGHFVFLAWLTNFK